MSDFGFPSSAVDDVDDDFAPTSTAGMDAGAVDPFGDDVVTPSAPAGGDAGLDFGFTSAAPVEETAPVVTETKDADDAFGFSAPVAQPDAQQVSALAAWRVAHTKAVNEKQEAERKEKAALAKQAQDEIAKFYAKRDETAKKTATRNRADEKQQRADLKNTMENGTDYEKVAKYTELRIKDEAKPPKNDRMRKLLIQLKNERPKA